VPAVSILAIKISLFFFFLFKKNTLIAVALAVFSGSEVNEVLYKIQSMLDAALAGFSSETYHTKKITKLLWHLLILSWQPQTTFTKNWMKLRRKKLLDIPHRLLHETGGI